tara:strand:+ start:1718 stop:2797 length:1080 start_codon:yes stop_codon:yes gene_type:complete
VAYTTIDNPELYFQTKLYTGTGSSNAITLDGSENMQPDWVWIKCRDDSHNHQVFDSVRGVHKRMRTDTTGAETQSSESLKSFDTDGFTVGTQANVNASASGDNSFVAWNWKAGTSFSNDASATSVGTLDSSGSTNQTAGFSIVSYTGAGGTQSVAHNLGGTPEMIIFKCRETATDWTTFHKGLGGANKHLSLNQTAAAGTDTDFFANTNPTSTVFSVGAASNTNRTSEGMIAYCFRSIKGYSKFGSYTGNASEDGIFIYTGFRPAWVVFKNISASNDWFAIDIKRDTLAPNNPVGRKSLNLNSSAVEVTRTTKDMDFVSNGIKLRTADGTQNNNGENYIYMAFAESPFVSSSGIPTTAR